MIWASKEKLKVNFELKLKIYDRVETDIRWMSAELISLNLMNKRVIADLLYRM